MSARAEMVGNRFGRLVVIEELPQPKPGVRRFRCRCNCGETADVRASNLRSGLVVSCGCSKRGDLTGQNFGRWTVVSLAGVETGKSQWNVVCDCGNTGVLTSSKLGSGKARSCGCLRDETAIATHTTHGDARQQHADGRRRYVPEYTAWANIKRRCYDPKNEHFADYGGRGISVCKRWLESYENFVADMGRKPSPQHSIDRIDNDGNYDPANCRWATQTEQNLNQRPRRPRILK